MIVGLTAAYLGGVADEVLMRIADVFMAFPQIVLALLLVTAFGPKVWLIVLVVGISHAPRVARVIRGAALQVVERDFVKAAEAVGESRRRIIFGELLPNVHQPAAGRVRAAADVLDRADRGDQLPRARPAAADRRLGLMINENRLAVAVQPWGVLLPVHRDRAADDRHQPDHRRVARAAIGIDRGE